MYYQIQSYKTLPSQKDLSVHVVKDNAIIQVILFLIVNKLKLYFQEDQDHTFARYVFLDINFMIRVNHVYQESIIVIHTRKSMTLDAINVFNPMFWFLRIISVTELSINVIFLTI